MRKRLFALLLCLALSLSACGQESVETPEPTPTAEETAMPAPSSTPAPEIEPIPPTVAMERPDLTGEWHRTNCHSGHQATLTISGQSEDSFLVEADCWYYSHSGVWEPTPARFIGESTALVEEYGYGLEEEDKPPVKFVWEGNTLTVETTAWYQLGFGVNVDINGTYTREKPTYTNAGALERCLTAEQQKLLLELGEEYQHDILHAIENGCPGDPNPCRLADGRQGTQLEIYFPTLSYYNWSLIFTEDGKVYGQNNPNFYTNDPSITEMPEVVWPLRDDTHDYFAVPTGGKMGTVLVTVELVEVEGTFFEEQHFSVWTASDLINPLQTMTAEDVTCFKWKDIRDANFDGYIDFGYMFAMGNQPAYYHYWIWDEEQGLFVAEPEFDRISWPQFDEETGVISGWARSSCCSGIETYHCWEDGKLVCVRQIELHYPEHNEDGTFNQLATVEDRINGELTEVFREYCTNEEESGTYPFEEVWKWEDLNYHGE